jgi:hypothetical protein
MADTRNILGSRRSPTPICALQQCISADAPLDACAANRALSSILDHQTYPTFTAPPYPWALADRLPLTEPERHASPGGKIARDNPMIPRRKWRARKDSNL